MTKDVVGREIKENLGDLRLKFVLLNNCSLTSKFMFTEVTSIVNRQIVNPLLLREQQLPILRKWPDFIINFHL